MPYVAAIDAGTTGVKTLVFDDGGRVCGAAAREIAVSYPRAGWVEQDATEIVAAAVATVAEAAHVAGIGAADLSALGITNQRSSVVAWDGPTRDPLAPMIVWQDVRTAERCRELQNEGLFIQPMMAASKAEWLLANVESVADARASGRLRFGTLNSYLVAALAGDVNLTDHGNASASGMYSYFENDWDAGVLAGLGLDAGLLPKLVPTAEVFATSDGERLGAAVPIAAMAGDQQASLFGLACVDKGQTKASYGTSAMVTANAGNTVGLGGAGTYPVVGWSLGDEVVFTLEGNVVTAGAAVQWLRDGLGIIDDAAETGALASSVADTGGVWAVPALQGLGTPWMSDGARAVVGGLSRASGKAEIVRAVLESIAHRIADVADSVWEQSGPAPLLRVDGGARRNDFLMQTQADLLGIAVERSPESHGGAMGAAKLAGLAVGVWNSVEETAGVWKADRVFEPAIDAGRRDEARATWRRRVEFVLGAVE